MKRCIIILALCSIVTYSIASEFQPIFIEPQLEDFSRSFMYLRPAYDHLSMREHLWHLFDYPTESCIRGTFQAIAFLQDSIHQNACNGDNRFARYFLPNGENQPLMAGDDTPFRYIRDLRAEWFNLPSDFSGRLTLAPEQFQAGFLFEYIQDLGALFDSCFFDGSYLNLMLPFVHVKNNLNLRQHNVQNPRTTLGGPTDIIEAFDQPTWHFDRIDGDQTTNHFTEFRICMNRIFMDEDNYQFAYYTGIIIPTAPKPNPKFLFNAYAGNGQHFGLNGGVTININLSCINKPALWSLFANLDGTFLVKNKQRRTVDLRHKQWSRFLLFNRENDPINVNIPGVNVLTIRTLVRSYGVFDFSTGFRYKTNFFELEAGYNVWGHDEERIEFIEPFATDLGIAAPGLNDQGLPQTASTSTIAQLGPTDPVFVPIKASDLDLQSAAAGSALNQKFHAAAGIYLYGDITAFMGLGMFVDWAHKNAALPTWGGWAKLGLSF